jgi:hypothetical protein
MTPRLPRLVAFLLTMSCGGALAAEPASPPPWSERGVFVFGPVVLDFPKSVERFDNLVDGPTNCSNAEHYCVDGTIFHLVLPKTCRDMKVGESWTLDGITTAVLRQDAGTYYLGDPARPSAVYEYEHDAGVMGFYYDALGIIDFVRLARETGIPADYRKQESLGPDSKYFSLTSLDLFGRCEPR